VQRAVEQDDDIEDAEVARAGEEHVSRRVDREPVRVDGFRQVGVARDDEPRAPWAALVLRRGGEDGESLRKRRQPPPEQPRRGEAGEACVHREDHPPGRQVAARARGSVESVAHGDPSRTRVSPSSGLERDDHLCTLRARAVARHPEISSCGEPRSGTGHSCRVEGCSERELVTVPGPRGAPRRSWSRFGRRGLSSAGVRGAERVRR
jgi:hypothetical protein